MSASMVPSVLLKANSDSRDGWISPRARACALGLLATALFACSTGGAAAREPDAKAPAGECSSGSQLKIHVYDVGQAAAALVELPDGRAILVDAGGHKTALAPKLEADLHGRPITMVWITHPHDDHINQLKAVLKHFKVETYVDNGFDGGTPSKKSQGGMGHRMRVEAAGAGATVVSASEGGLRVPIPNSKTVTLSAVAPARWSHSCATGNANNCSLGLRIDYCGSSILFLGDAEADEEANLPLKPASLLVVPHHGSRTSTSQHLLDAVRPKYAVISAGRNSQFCHPNGGTVARLSAAIGGPAAATPVQVGGVSDRACGWAEASRSAQVWVTAADGDVVLVTEGGGAFRREIKKAGP